MSYKFSASILWAHWMLHNLLKVIKQDLAGHSQRRVIKTVISQEAQSYRCLPQSQLTMVLGQLRGSGSYPLQ